MRLLNGKYLLSINKSTNLTVIFTILPTVKA